MTNVTDPNTGKVYQVPAKYSETLAESHFHFIEKWGATRDTAGPVPDFLYSGSYANTRRIMTAQDYEGQYVTMYLGDKPGKTIDSLTQAIVGLEGFTVSVQHIPYVKNIKAVLLRYDADGSPHEKQLRAYFAKMDEKLRAKGVIV